MITGQQPTAKRAGELIGPERVFRDDRWTIIDFGKNTEGRIRVLPIPSRVIDRTESPVTHRYTGKGRFLIVEAIGEIVLRDGQNVVCLHLAGTPRTVNNSEGQTIYVIPQNPPQQVTVPTQQNQNSEIVIQQEPPKKPAPLPVERNSITVSDLSPIVLKRILTGISYLSVNSNNQNPSTFRIEGVVSVHSGEVCRRTAEAGGQCYVSIAK